jgi:MFS family permease
MDDRSPRSAVAVLLGRRDFRNLLIGQGISGLGDWMGTIALMALVLDITGSSTAVGAVLVLRIAPAAFAGPTVQALSRRWDRRRTMLACDVVRAGIVALIPFVHALWWVYTLAFALEAAGLVFLPSRDSLIPELAGADQLNLANGLVLGSSYGTIPLGAGAVAIISGLTGSVSVAFWIDAGTFLISFAMISLLPAVAPVEPVTPDEQGAGASFKIPLVRRVAPFALLVSLGLGTLFSVGIVFVRDVLHSSDVEFAVLVALFGVGAALGLALLQLVQVEPSVSVVQRLVLAQGLIVATMSLSPGIALALVGAVLFGGATATTLSSAMSLLQEQLVDRERVLAFNAFHVVIRAGIGVAAIGGGVAVDVLSDVRWPVVGELEPARVVLVSAGLLVALTATAARVHDRATQRQAAC